MFIEINIIELARLMSMEINKQVVIVVTAFLMLVFSGCVQQNEGDNKRITIPTITSRLSTPISSSIESFTAL